MHKNCKTSRKLSFEKDEKSTRPNSGYDFIRIKAISNDRSNQ